jgi:phage terminase large subunit-like protein
VTFLAESDQALWSRTVIDGTRVKALPKDLWFKRLVVAVDPATTNKSSSNMTGIVVVGLGNDDHIYVINDSSGIYSPDEWAHKCVRLFTAYQCDRVVAEVNQGGDMVKHTLRTVAPNLPIEMVRASRSKQARAEPVSALWEQGKAHIVGSMPMLEDQLCQWEPLSGAESPDRLDALVWGVTYVGVLNQFVGQSTIKGLY